MTDKQAYAIEMIETYLDIRFQGNVNDSYQVWSFINEHYEKAKKAKSETDAYTDMEATYIYESFSEGDFC